MGGWAGGKVQSRLGRRVALAAGISPNRPILGLNRVVLLAVRYPGRVALRKRRPPPRPRDRGARAAQDVRPPTDFAPCVWHQLGTVRRRLGYTGLTN